MLLNKCYASYLSFKPGGPLNPEMGEGNKNKAFFLCVCKNKALLVWKGGVFITSSGTLSNPRPRGLLKTLYNRFGGSSGPVGAL